MVTRSSLVFLCDLTYTQQTISSDIMPAAVGCVATYAERELGDQVQIEIFKFPETLIGALESGRVPRAIGFSNYAWNEDLSTEFARIIKSKLPDVVTIFGGPNYPTMPHEQERFLRSYPQIDFYIVKEGEIGFSKLLTALIAADFNAALVDVDLPSVHRIKDGTFFASPTAARIRNMAEIPSPYLSGKMDQFFDGVMLPIIQTNRGCPFKCTFCVEGVDYYNKVAKTMTLEKVNAELEYIAERMTRLRETKGGRADLHVADSNFGMYPEDIEICHFIADKQKRFAYPEYINVATGKNKKERVLEAATIINGALRLSGAVQSLDETVLQNIKRSNIDVQQIMTLALEASRIGANSYSEIILGPPGDTVEGHLRTIKIIVEADFNIVCLYQLMLLPGTDLASDESVDKWGMVTKYRAIPRCYGYFDLFGEQINACEIERICVANQSLSFQQYLECRKMHLIINLFYNDGMLKEVLRLIRMLGLSVYEWLEHIYRDTSNKRLNALIARFLEETQSELWQDCIQFRAFTRDRENVKRLIAGELGANLIFKYRSMALLAHADDIADVARRALEALFDRHDVSDFARALGEELIVYGHSRMSGIFGASGADPEHLFRFNVVAFSDRPESADPSSYLTSEPVVYRFIRTNEQSEIVARYTSIYGTTLAGLSRILAKVYVRKLFRQPIDVTTSSTISVASRDIRFGQAALTGLNEFG